MAKKLFIIIEIVLIIFSLMSCSKSTNIDLTEQKVSNNSSIVCGANQFGYVNIYNNGILYIENQLIKTYDFNTEKKYPLCSKSNCTHSSTDCSAYIALNDKAEGLTYYDGKVYTFIDRFENNKIDFVQMDIDGTNKKILYTLNKGSYKPDTWQLSDITDIIYYSNGMVWFILNWEYIVDKDEIKDGYSQLAYINLSNRKITFLTDKSNEKTKYEYSYFTNNNAIYCKKYRDEAPLSDEEFYKQYKENTFNNLPGDESYDLYYRYLLQFNDQYPEKYEYFNYNLNNEKTLSIDTGNNIPLYDDVNNKNSAIVGFATPYLFCGEYSGKLLVNLPDYNRNGNYKSEFFLWDINNAQKTELMKLNMYGILGVYSIGNFGVNILDNTKMLYCIDKGKEKVDIYQLNLDTLESNLLFEDSKYISLRIIYETDTEFLANSGDPSVSDPQTIYRISKSDYFDGNLKSAKKIKL